MPAKIPELGTYLRLPETVEAYHFETGGTYEVFGSKIEVKDDTYAYLQGRNIMTMSGDKFREKHIEDGQQIYLGTVKVIG